MLKKCLNSLGEKKQKKKDKVEQIASFPAGSLGPMSCPGTGAPTLEWNRTSASSARRSLPAVITCPNTSKSTAFHEAAGQDALPTDSFDPSDRLTLSGEGGREVWRRRRGDVVGRLCSCTCVCDERQRRAEWGGKVQTPLKWVCAGPFSACVC